MVPKASRLGYMGHLTLVTEDVVTALKHYPADLQIILAQYTPQPTWDTYVNGVYAETKKKDNTLLGGGKPVLTSSATTAVQRWKVDEEDTGGISTKAFSPSAPAGESIGSDGMRGEFRRTTSMRPRREGSADFGVAPIMEDEEDDGDEDDAAPPQVSNHATPTPIVVESH
jgi:serine/threonine-protein phosphatase 6 regulatory subunit 3